VPDEVVEPVPDELVEPCSPGDLPLDGGTPGPRSAELDVAVPVPAGDPLRRAEPPVVVGGLEPTAVSAGSAAEVGTLLVVVAGGWS
jgi:hypothetical protein